MTSLMLSHGVPMISGGDELGRTQRGNNNAYCQDNDISWTDWVRDAEVKDIAWLDTSAREMTDREWGAVHVRHLGVLLAGDAIDEVDERGQHIRGDSLLILLNADRVETVFALPAAPAGGQWRLVFDTAVAEGTIQELAVAGPYTLQARATAVFRTG